MRVAGLRLQPHLDGYVAGQIHPLAPLLVERFLDAQDLDLVDAEVDVDRLQLNERRELCWRPGADERADIDQMGRQLAIEGRRHLGVAEIDLRQLEIGLGLIDRRPI